MCPDRRRVRHDNEIENQPRELCDAKKYQQQNRKQK